MSENKGIEEERKGTLEYQNIDELRDELDRRFKEFAKKEKPQGKPAKAVLSRRSFLKLAGVAAVGLTMGAGLGVSMEAGKESGSPEGFLGLVREKAEKLYTDSKDPDSLYDSYYALQSAMHKGWKPPPGYKIETRGIFYDNSTGNFIRVVSRSDEKGITMSNDSNINTEKVKTPIEIFDRPIANKNNMYNVDVTIWGPAKPFPANSVPQDLLSPLGNVEDIAAFSDQSFWSVGLATISASLAFAKREMKQYSLYTSMPTDPEKEEDYYVANVVTVYPDMEDNNYLISRGSDRLITTLDPDKYGKTSKLLDGVK